MNKRSGFFRLMLLTLMIAVIGTGCQKDELETGIGYVLNTGSYQSGGCEFVLELNLKLYQPRNLPVQFRIDSLPVQVTYKIINSTVDCPNPTGFGGSINIQRIEVI